MQLSRKCNEGGFCGHFSHIIETKLLCFYFLVAIFDVAHDVETIFHLQFAVTRVSLRIQKIVLDAESSESMPCIVSTACMWSHIANKGPMVLKTLT